MKSFSLILSIALIVLFFAVPEQMAMKLGVSDSSTWITRITYQFLHVNVIHLAINVYAILLLSFLSGARLWQFILSFTIASLIPSSITSDSPMLGLSVLNFALTGMLLMNSRRWKRFLLLNVVLILPTFILYNVAASAHLYALIAGAAVGFFTAKRYA